MVRRIKILAKSFKYALKGIKNTFLEQQNFKIQSVVGMMAVILAIVLKINYVEFAIIVAMVGLVLILELINTAFERMVDILKPRIHVYAGNIKDILAGAVLIASVVAVLVGIFIFLPYIV